ncbi:MAG: hypothetical protein HY717_16050 [Planctomycetes bacterium]|nr:hypothetical protein [Planctomycetota bacterium]
MKTSMRIDYTWHGAKNRLQRMAKANARADEEWLRSLSMEESIRIFEDLCLGIPELGVTSQRDSPPVVLWRIWRS